MLCRRFRATVVMRYSMGNWITTPELWNWLNPQGLIGSCTIDSFDPGTCHDEIGQNGEIVPKIVTLTCSDLAESMRGFKDGLNPLSDSGDTNK